MGKNLLNYNSLLVLTHFKGHVQGGFGGSDKNLGIGCADGQIGKAMIHTTPGTADMWDIGKEEFMARMSVSCDCEGCTALSVVTPNIGMVASTDILAADQASIDLVYALDEKDHAERMNVFEHEIGPYMCPCA